MKLKLNKELMTRWIKALESGRYRQGREALKQKDGSGHVRYCCLGVLQKLEPKIKQDKADGEMLDEASVRKILGCDLDQVYLSEANDGANYELEYEPQTFKQIAQHLRKKYKITA